MKTLQALPENTDLKTIDLELLNQIESAINNGNNGFKTVSHPTTYLVIPLQIEAAKKVKEEKTKKYILENKGKLIFCGRGWHKAENTNNVGNCRISTTIQTKKGEQYYIELIKSYQGFICFDFAIDIQKRNKKESLLNAVCEKLKTVKKYSDESRSLHKELQEINNIYNEYNFKNLERETYLKKITWTKENILNLVNENFNTDFKDIEIDNFLITTDNHKSINI